MAIKKAKEAILFFIMTIFVYALFPLGVSANADTVDVIVTYKDEVPETLELLNYENGVVMEKLPIKTMTIPIRELDQLQQDPNVLSVSIDQPLHLMINPSEESESSRVLSDFDWNNEMVKAFDAWDDGFTGKGVKVAVLDTGFAEHQDITYAGGYSVIEGESYLNDYDGHGTHVAGIIGADKGTPYQGIAPDVELYGVKVFSEHKGGTTSDLIAGIDWAIKENIDIINMSLGFGDEVPAVHTAIQEAVNQGMIVVAASGNEGNEEGTGEQIEYPAKYEEVIAVAAVDQELTRFEFSAVGPENELAAPGASIWGLAPHNDYDSMSGTSQSTPHVTAMAAILMEKYPNYSNGQIRKLLTEKAFDLGPEGRDPLHGYGLVQYAPFKIEPPVIEYNGEYEMDVEYGSTFEFPTATVSHSVDELDVVATLFNEDGEEVNPEQFSTEIPGSYTLIFSAEDTLGQQAEEVRVTITVQPFVDTVPPVIQYDGDREIEIEHGGELVIPTVTVTDNVDEQIEANVTIFNEAEEVVQAGGIDTTIPATYVIVYEAIDEAGNEAEPLFITLTVLDKESDKVKEPTGGQAPPSGNAGGGGKQEGDITPPNEEVQDKDNRHKHSGNADNQESKGESLPNTATNYYNWLTLGFILIISGVIAVTFRRRLSIRA